MTSQLFNVVGITNYKNGYKVRFTNDMCRRIKRCANDGAVRLDFVELPYPMTKIDALKYMLSLAEFKSEDDQKVIRQALAKRDKIFANIETHTEKPRRGRPPRKYTTIQDILEAIKND